MLVFGEPNLVPAMITRHPNTLVVNFTSLLEGYPKLDILPDPSTLYWDDNKFDQYYNTHIFCNDNVFLSFFTNIMMPLYMGTNVYMMVDNREGSIFQMVTMSLIKIIQCRYGYIGAIINSIDDLDYVEEGLFTPDGIQRFDFDKNRWTVMTAANMTFNQILNTNGIENSVGVPDTYGI